MRSPAWLCQAPCVLVHGQQCGRTDGQARAEPGYSGCCSQLVWTRCLLCYARDMPGTSHPDALRSSQQEPGLYTLLQLHFLLLLLLEGRMLVPDGEHLAVPILLGPVTRAKCTWQRIEKRKWQNECQAGYQCFWECQPGPQLQLRRVADLLPSEACLWPTPPSV